MFKPIKILHITEAMGSNYYGVAQVLLWLTRFCRAAGAESKILAAVIGDMDHPDFEYEKLPAIQVRRGLFIHYGMEEFIKKQIGEFSPDVMHVHGALTSIQCVAIRVANKMGLPVLVSPHGMLEPWLWQQKGLLYYWAKTIYWRLYLRPAMRCADYVHAITSLESGTIGRWLPDIPQIQIPNAIELSDWPVRPTSELPGKVFLFLGRLHPKKGVELLINAFHQAQLDDVWRLVIVGPNSDPEYARTLHDLVRELNLEGRVDFFGPLFGEDKIKLLQRSWVTVTPSFSEVVGLVNLESAASQTPAITTFETGLSDWNEGGGCLIHPDVNQLSGELRKAAGWSLAERIAYGDDARQFIEARYSWAAIGKKWLEVYEKISVREKIIV